MCAVVCSAMMVTSLCTRGLDPATHATFKVLVGFVISCLWLAVAPPRMRAAAFVPSVLPLGFSGFDMIVQAPALAEYSAAAGLRHVGICCLMALVLLLLGMALLAGRVTEHRNSDSLLSSMPVYDAAQNARELRVAASAFVTAAAAYLLMGLKPAEGQALLRVMPMDLALCCFGIATEEAIAQLVLRSDTFCDLLEQEQALGSGVRMIAWLAGSLVAAAIVAGALSMMWQDGQQTFALYSWLGAGAWFGMAYRLRRAFSSLQAELAPIESAARS